MNYLDTNYRRMLRKVVMCLTLVTSILSLSATSSNAQQPFEVYPSQMVTRAGMGQSVEYGVTIYNYLSSDLTLTITITGPDAVAYSAPASVTLEEKNGDSASAGGFTFTFSPTQFGLHTATIEISDGNITRQIKLTGVGEIPAPQLSGRTSWSAQANDSDCDQMRIFNQTASQIIITDISLNGDGTFAITNGPALPVVLQPGESFDITVCFNPMRQGTWTDSILVNYQVTGTAGVVVRGLYGVGTGNQVACVTLDGDSTFGYVDADQTAVREFTVSNISGVTLELDAVLTGDPHFKILSPALPYSLPASSSVTFAVKLYSGNDNTKQFFSSLLTVMATDSNQISCDSRINLYAVGSYTGQPVDSNQYSLTGDEKEKLKIEGESGDSYRIFQFVNGTGDSITVTSVEMKKGDDFSARVLFNPPVEALPLTLMPNDVMLVRVDVINENAGDYKDDLIITVENSIAALEFEVEGTVVTSSVTTPAKNSVAKLTLSENPATGPVTISVSNARESKIALLDLTGRMIVETAEPVLRWNAQTADAATSQIYLVRATGVDELGQPFVVTERLVIVK